MKTDEQKEEFIPSQDPLLRDLLESMGETSPPLKAPEDPPANPPAEPPPASAAPPAPDDKPGDKPDDPPKAPDVTPAPDAAAAAKEAAKPAVSFSSVSERLDQIKPHHSVMAEVKDHAEKGKDQDYISTLHEDAQAEIADMEEAEVHLGEKYKGARAKIIDYYKQVDATVERLRKEDPSRTFDETDDGFTQAMRGLLKTKPRIGALDKRKVLEASISARAARTVAPEIDKVAQASAEIAAKEHLDAAMAEFDKKTKQLIFETADVPELKELAADEKNPDLKLEADIVESQLQAHRVWAVEYAKVGRRLTSMNERDMTKTQQDLNAFLHAVGTEYAATGKTKLKDGREFLPQHEYRKLYKQIMDGEKPRSEWEKYWSFSEQQVIGLIALKTRNQVCEQLKFERARFEQYGLKRTRSNSAEAKKEAENNTPKTPDPVPVKAVTARPAPPASGLQQKGKMPDEDFNPVALYGLSS